MSAVECGERKTARDRSEHAAAAPPTQATARGRAARARRGVDARAARAASVRARATRVLRSRCDSLSRSSSPVSPSSRSVSRLACSRSPNGINAPVRSVLLDRPDEQNAAGRAVPHGPPHPSAIGTGSRYPRFVVELRRPGRSSRSSLALAAPVEPAPASSSTRAGSPRRMERTACAMARRRAAFNCAARAVSLLAPRRSSCRLQPQAARPVNKKILTSLSPWLKEWQSYQGLCTARRRPGLEATDGHSRREHATSDLLQMLAESPCKNTDSRVADAHHWRRRADAGLFSAPWRGIARCRALQHISRALAGHARSTCRVGTAPAGRDRRDTTWAAGAPGSMSAGPSLLR
jgi:hypothetical protein